ncbi:MAG TPA: colanic acid biosynthesis glycosyltransferase WcaL [Chloroflexi bacterium]|nr:colanic acid biosynthesis glycosyltransferase WcaL [Chloroflexota bacterium]
MSEREQPLRLGIYVMRFPVSSETFIATKVAGLLDAGFDVHIFAHERSNEWDRFEMLRDRLDIRSRIHYAPPARPWWKITTVGLWHLLRKAIRHPGAFVRYILHNWRNRHEHPLGFWKAVYERLAFVGHDLDILHVEFDTQALSVVDIKHYLGCKLLLSTRGTFQKTSVLDRFPGAPAYLYRHVDGYHAISRYLLENAYRLGLSRSVPIWLIEPAIDLTLFSPNGTRRVRRPDEPLRIISVGRLDWQKGYEFALDAVARVHQAGIPVHYTILGRGPYKSAVLFAAHQWGLLQAGVVELAGVVPREEVPAYMQEADVMLHAAVEEGFCNAVIEAQAMGLPVVTSDAGGLVENVIDGVTGFVVPRRDPDALAEKLILLAQDPELCQRMGEAGRKHALERFDLQDQIEAFASLYRELARGPER